MEAQSVTATEIYGPVAANHVAGALGFSCSPRNEWEFAAVAAMGGRWCRWDDPWVEGEIEPGRYVTPPGTAAGLAFAKRFGIHPLLTVDYGPPYHAIATGMLETPIANGSTTVSLRLTEGSLAGFVAGQTAVALPPGSGFISPRHGYAGVIATGVSGDTITLASAANQQVAAGTVITVNRLMYPPVIVPPGGSYRDNASVKAYAAYARYVAQSIVAAGDTGYAEIWNEPPWADECWDAGVNCYDHPPPSEQLFQPGGPGNTAIGVELPAYLATTQPVAGAPYVNGYTHKSGGPSLMNPALLNRYPPVDAARDAFAAQMFHPYANNPEDHIWLPQCIERYKTVNSYADVLAHCTPAGMVRGDQTWEQAFHEFPGAHGGIPQGISEMGLARDLSRPIPTETQVTRFHLRQFLGSAGDGEFPIVFYRLYDTSGQGFGFYSAPGEPYPVVASLKALMHDISAIGKPPVASYAACGIPRVTGYRGYYPLAVAPFVGTSAGAQASSILMFVWQRSYGPTYTASISRDTMTVTRVSSGTLAVGQTIEINGNEVIGRILAFGTGSGGTGTYIIDHPQTQGSHTMQATWTSVASPGAVPLSVGVPAGYTVSGVKNMVSLRPVAHTVDGTTLTFGVTDDPMEIAFTPSSGTVAQGACR